MLFWKMNGLGNDYVFIDVARFVSKKEKAYLENNIEKLTTRLSDRHFGIGSDGVVLISPSEIGDASMRIFNADGSEGMMCGNALRCVCKYLFDSGVRRAKEYAIDTLSGLKRVVVEARSDKVVSATADMGIVTGARISEGVYTVNVGNPHVVFITDKACDSPDFSEAKAISKRYDANVEFVHLLSQNELDVSVYERGSGVTLACGTGATAAAYAAMLEYPQLAKTVNVNLKGGSLNVEFEDNRAFLTGDTALNYIGEVNLGI